MIAQIHTGGGNFAGVIAYLTHDAGTEADPRPTRDDRVGFTEVENLVPCDPARAARIMAATARDADALKELAGVSAKGRKLTKPVYHFSLSWARDEKPDQATMLGAAQDSLRSLGMQDRQAVVIEHRDRPHPHVHVVVNRVSPEDGRAASNSHDARTLSTWAANWEREHGGIRCLRRLRRRGRDCSPGGRASRRRARRRSAGRASSCRVPADRRRVRRRRIPDDHRQRRRGLGRRDRSPAERKQWAELYQRHRADRATAGGSEDQELDKRHALERAGLARELERDQQRRRSVELERQRELERRREAATAARERRWKALASFPGAQAAAHYQFDQREPSWRDRNRVSPKTFDQALDDIEGQVDKSLNKQEADLKARLRNRDGRGLNLLARARADALGRGQAPADRQERAQVLNAADRLDVAERALDEARLNVEERHEITPSHRSLQAAAVEVTQDPRTSRWGRDIAGAIATGKARPGYDDPGPEGETEQIRARIRTIDEEAAAEAAKAADQKADQEHGKAVKTWEQLSFFQRVVTPRQERQKPKAPEPPTPPTPARIESYRDAIARIAARAINAVIRHFQPELDPERRSRIPDPAPPAPEPERDRRNRDRGGGMEL